MQSKDLMFSISMAKKPSSPSKEALLLKRKRTGAIKKENEAPRARQIGTDPQGGAEKVESSHRQDEGTSGIAGDHLIMSYSSGIHLSNTPL